MANLADFLRDQEAQERAKAPERERQREEWLEAVECLLRQMETWLNEADASHLLEVERTSVPNREVGLGIYSAPGLKITLGARQLTVSPIARQTVGPFLDDNVAGSRSQGRVDITDGAIKFMVYRYVDDRGERWVMLDDVNYQPVPFDRHAFETAIVSLLK